VHCVCRAAAPDRAGDDMGAAHAVNEAIIKCHKEGIQTSIEVIVPSPWFPEAAKMLAENPTVDVGVHLALSSEWDNVKWRPVSDCPSLRDADGYFHPMIYPNKNYPGRSLKDHDWKLEDVEKEFRAQIELAVKRLPNVSHLSGHMGALQFLAKSTTWSADWPPNTSLISNLRTWASRVSASSVRGGLRKRRSSPLSGCSTASNRTKRTCSSNIRGSTQLRCVRFITWGTKTSPSTARE
jgi:predicted glycoside hydrolase/deacetylase ChbG (UPF0249 family)